MENESRRSWLLALQPRIPQVIHSPSLARWCVNSEREVLRRGAAGLQKPV